MRYLERFRGRLGFGFLLLLPLVLAFGDCARKGASADLPKDILGVGVGMSKEDAEHRLREIGKFSRDDVKNQQLWFVRDDPHFGSLAVGYDKENRVRYVAGIAKVKGGELMRFSQVGDVKSAKAEIVGPNHKYVWDVPAANSKPAQTIIAQGNNADYLSMLTLAGSSAGENEEDEEEERREKEERK